MSEHDNDEKEGDTIVPIDPESTIPRQRPRVVRTIEAETTVPIVDKNPVKIESRWRRMGPIFVALAVVLALGPFISRFIDAYRAVVIDVREGELLIVADSLKIPRWVEGSAEPGQVVIKEALSWSPKATQPVPRDGPLLELHRRWMVEYEGQIVEMRPPHAPGQATVAVVQTRAGERIDVPLWAEHLATAGIGRFLKKEARAWDPYLVAGPAGAPPPLPPGAPQPPFTRPASAPPSATFELAPPKAPPPK